MNKQKFEQLVKQTGANKCVEFNWSYTLKDSCERCYLESGILKPCVLLTGGKCEVLKQ